MTQKTIHQRFVDLNNERGSLMERKREAAAFTMPIRLPPDGWDEQDELDCPLNSKPALGSASLASKITNAVLPNNGSAITSPRVLIPEGAPQAAVEFIKNAVNGFDAEIMDRLGASNFRAELGNVALDLVIVGDVLLEALPNGQFRSHRLDNYVVIRREDGSVHELIIRTWVDPETLPKKLQDIQNKNNVRQGLRRLEPKYTMCIWEEEKNEYSVRMEFRETDITENAPTYKALPYFPLKTGTPANSNYGESLIEVLTGDIRTLMGLTLALIEGAAANSEFRFCVDPAGTTNLNHMANSKNGQWCSARSADLSVMQLGSPAQLQSTAQMVQVYETAILQALLYDRAFIAQDRERVTATEIQATIQSLESGLTGILASITQDLHVPLVKRMSEVIARDETVSKTVRALAEQVASGNAPLRLKSGIEALHKEILSMRLLQGVNTLIRLPEPAFANINWRSVVFDLMHGFGFDGSRYLISEEEMAAQQQQAAALRVQENAGMAAGDALAKNIGDVNANPA